MRCLWHLPNLGETKITMSADRLRAALQVIAKRMQSTKKLVPRPARRGWRPTGGRARQPGRICSAQALLKTLVLDLSCCPTAAGWSGLGPSVTAPGGGASLTPICLGGCPLAQTPWRGQGGEQQLLGVEHARAVRPACRRSDAPLCAADDGTPRRAATPRRRHERCRSCARAATSPRPSRRGPWRMRCPRPCRTCPSASRHCPVARPLLHASNTSPCARGPTLGAAPGAGNQVV
jgi:hypothetical protein